MPKIRLPSLSECCVFFDFDNTITLYDVLDDIVRRFSVNKEWQALEKAWREGRIGSRECIGGQLQLIRVTKKELERYISRVKIDPHFHQLFAMLKREGIGPVILSDSFSFIIKSVLSNNGINGVKVYANKLRFDGNRLIPSFPYQDKLCNRCAHCKKKNLLKTNVKDKIIIYIGDGLSDVCPAECSDLVFAKGNLLEHFRSKKMLCVAFRSISDICNYFRGLEK